MRALVLEEHGRPPVLREVARELTERRRQEQPVPEPSPAPELPDPGHVVGPLELCQHQSAEAKRLCAEGWSIQQIAAELQLNRRTVTKYIHAEHLPRRVLPQATSSLVPYVDYLRERWTAGECNGPRVLADLHERSYNGSLSSLYRVLKTFRSRDGRPLPMMAATPRVAVRSLRQAAWLLTHLLEDLSDEDLLYRNVLCARVPQIATAADLGQRFIQMLGTRQRDVLDLWLEDAEASTIKELANFVRSLRRDYAALTGALSTDWSNGPAENRLKMTKRTMYGHGTSTASGSVSCSLPDEPDLFHRSCERVPTLY
ncbi:MAG: transposase [Ardenticatenaceae bacterium]|nr:transposase [Ardenticatenaceae bacterium]